MYLNAKIGPSPSIPTLNLILHYRPPPENDVNESKKNISAASCPLSLHRLCLLSSRPCLFPCLLVWLVVALSCCVSSFVLSHCIVPSLSHATLHCVASSHLVITARRLILSLSCLVLTHCCVTPPCTSHHTCFVWSVVALSHCISSLLPLAHLVIMTCYCVACCCCVVSRLVDALHLVIMSRRVVFCRPVWFSWLLHRRAASRPCFPSRVSLSRVAIVSLAAVVLHLVLSTHCVSSSRPIV